MRVPNYKNVQRSWRFWNRIMPRIHIVVNTPLLIGVGILFSLPVSIPLLLWFLVFAFGQIIIDTTTSKANKLLNLLDKRDKKRIMNSKIITFLDTKPSDDEIRKYILRK